MTADTSTTDDAASPSSALPVETALPVNRDWVKKLILEHSNHPNDGKALVVAPMVDQSDYPFRLLCRKYGSNLAFTPMIHSKLLVNSVEYRAKFMPTAQHANDRPLIAQMCGHDPDILEKAAKMLLPYVDGIDLNCGCPQGIAKRGFYGAFLLENEEVLLNCVKRLVKTINKPVSVKVRLLPGEPQKSIDLFRKLVDSGIHLLTVHARTRHQNKQATGAADWDRIREVVDLFGHRLPIFANGSIADMLDVQRCFEHTGVDGVMSSEAILEYPALFLTPPVRIGRIQLAKEYLQLAKQHPPEKGGQGSGIKCLRAHVHRFVHEDLEDNIPLRQQVATAETWQVLWDAVTHIEALQAAAGHKAEEEALSWYMRHRILIVDERGNEKIINKTDLRQMQNIENDIGLADNPAAECFGSDLFGSEDGDY